MPSAKVRRKLSLCGSWRCRRSFHCLECGGRFHCAEGGEITKKDSSALCTMKLTQLKIKYLDIQHLSNFKKLKHRTTKLQ